jgi:4-hydroxy-3-methylbut-2-enyl diphosphate reductase IspH
MIWKVWPLWLTITKLFKNNLYSWHSANTQRLEEMAKQFSSNYIKLQNYLQWTNFNKLSFYWFTANTKRLEELAKQSSSNSIKLQNYLEWRINNKLYFWFAATTQTLVDSNTKVDTLTSTSNGNQFNLVVCVKPMN